ncbi:hypothetical protein L873DRAFT_1799264 [Choiromyces venosus 120613-1]|uniref:Uncharacterized protein n=1 Tax=Choiromyces venosus 120613-1 TaxID=1336337 RepID=A0A3N4K1G0_9PEZI|nr:hypothetical protein L873DRAFT_1799264 [Choiromyces venosus 120613-1]
MTGLFRWVSFLATFLQLPFLSLPFPSLHLQWFSSITGRTPRDLFVCAPMGWVISILLQD